MGRPGKYESRIKPHLEEIRDAVGCGATVEEIAAAFGVGISTIQRYKSTKKELAAAFNSGRANVKIKINAALLKKAIGYEYSETKTTSKGKKTAKVETYERYQPPSETAAAMLLRNFDRGEENEIEVVIKGGVPEWAE